MIKLKSFIASVGIAIIFTQSIIPYADELPSETTAVAETTGTIQQEDNSETDTENDIDEASMMILNSMGVSDVNDLTEEQRKIYDDLMAVTFNTSDPNSGQTYEQKGQDQTVVQNRNTEDIDSSFDNDIQKNVSKRPVTINAKVEFDDLNIEDTNIYTIYLQINGEPVYVNEEELSANYGKVLLNRENDFANQIDFDVTDQNLILTAYIDDDYVNAYRITIDDEEYGYKEITSDIQDHSIILHVTKPENTTTDTNLSSTLSATDRDYLSGRYAESRRSEIAAEIETASASDAEQTSNHSNLFKGIIILVVVIGAGAGAIWYYIKKVRDADDDD